MGMSLLPSIIRKSSCRNCSAGKGRASSKRRRAWTPGSPTGCQISGFSSIICSKAPSGKGHSFGGWTALATPEVEGRIGAVVALAPGGSTQPPPGIIPAQLTFTWGRDVPTLYLVAEQDSVLSLSGMYELFDRTLATKQLIILRRADHEHFVDDFEPQAGHCSREQAHLAVRGLTLCHLDAHVKQVEAAQRFWRGDVVAELTRRDADVIVPHR